jgi:hypothetical protein
VWSAHLSRSEVSSLARACLLASNLLTIFHIDRMACVLLRTYTYKSLRSSESLAQLP